MCHWRAPSLVIVYNYTNYGTLNLVFSKEIASHPGNVFHDWQVFQPPNQLWFAMCFFSDVIVVFSVFEKSNQIEIN